MMHLYRLSEQQAQAAAAVGVDDIERRQHVQQLTHGILAGCRQASQPFSWLRACGLRAVADALAAGLQDSQALMTVLEATYSQILEVILSTLDRDLIPPTPPPPSLPPLSAAAAPTLSAAAGTGGGSSSHQLGSEDQQRLFESVGRYPAGHAPAAASSSELRAAFCVMQALVVLHPKSRSLLSSAQYLQLATARACEVPACLPHALHTLLALLQGNEEAQAMFVTTGGLDMLLTRTLQHTQQQAATADGSSSTSSTDAPPDLLLQLLVFLQMLLGWGIGEAVRKGAHPSTQRAAVSHMTKHLGHPTTRALTQNLGQVVAAAGHAGPAADIPAAVAATCGASRADADVVAVHDVLWQRAELAAALILN